ncbi:ABC transporter permease [Alkalicoccobacillus plakortidis]|uniref:Iron ABC transporter permease n=1 Tax=Alkalicoccobacillus plakortidis TaxID=444060 RepID=A0ABT0XIY1_9BACI|nr:iron ABC transporter permease [Alkalicoccobacillus plakortidis]MCM2675863.1 iron ABC transporter permease [Alkalicoccobacillus plakortidis]
MKAKGQQLFKQPMRLILIVLIMACLIVFIAYPLVQIFLASFISNSELSFAGYQRVLSGGQLSSSLINSIVLASVVSVLSTAIAYFFAYVFAYVKIPFKMVFNGIAILPIISPPFVIALSAILLFGRNGFISSSLFGMENANIYGLHGLILVQTLTFFPVAFLVLSGLLRSISPALEEASDNLGSTKWQTFARVTLPLSLPGIGNAFLLVFIQSMADFGNPMTIGGDYNTVAREIYLQAVGSYNMQSGAALAMLLLSVTVILYAIQKFWLGKKNYVTVTGKPTSARRLVSDGPFRLAVITICYFISATVALFYVLVPIGSFIQLWGVNNSFTLEHYQYVFSIGQKAVVDTFKLAAIATPIGGLFAMVLAYLIVRQRFAGKRLMEGLSMMSIAIPGTVIGISYILAFNQAPFAITGTALIIIAAFIVRAMPVGIRSGVTSLQQIDPSIEEAATNLGASGSKTFFTIVLPLIRPAFFSSLVYTFVKSMTAMSAVIFLISAKYNLITASILAQVESGRIGVASAYCTLLIILMIAAMLVLNVLTNLFTKRWTFERKGKKGQVKEVAQDSISL